MHIQYIIRHRARACEARSGRGWSPSEASSTMSTSNDQRCRRSTIQRSTISTINDQRCRRWAGQRSLLGPTDPAVTSPSRSWNHFFAFQLRVQNWTRFESPKIHPKSSKKLRKPSPKPSQNGSQIASYVPTPEMFKNGTTMVRKPHFGSLLAFRNRLKIDAKTPSKSALCWIPSWNPKKYDF